MGFLDHDFIPLSVFLHHVVARGTWTCACGFPGLGQVSNRACFIARRRGVGPIRLRAGYALSDAGSAGLVYAAALREDAEVMAKIRLGARG